jgi:DNA-binding NarL/FixJ family response regulator
VLADDSVLFRRGLAELLGDAGVEIVAQVGDVQRLMSAVDALAPDAAVVDVRMPPDHTDDGIRAALELRKRHPSVGVLVLSTYVETDWVIRLLGGGTDGLGYLLKDRVDDVQSLVDALRRVARGGTALDQEVVARLVRRGGHGLERLSARQRDVLTLMAQGLSNAGIARRLSINERTIETHVTAIFTQLDLGHHDDVNRRVLAVLTLLRDTPH